jgi:hypothetical protein
MYEVKAAPKCRQLGVRMERSIEQRLDEVGSTSVYEQPAVAAAVRELVRTVAASDGAKVGRRRHRIKMIAGLCLALVLGGGTAATAGPALLAWAPWAPDAVIERAFPISGSAGSASCAVIVRVVPDPQTGGSDADTRLREAREFLQQHDWTTLDASIADIPAKELRGMTAQGISEQLMLTLRVGDQVGAQFEAAGHLGRGVALESAGRCDGESDQ